VAESVLSIEVLLAYDDNSNQEADFNEGVEGLSVRVVDGTTNRILGSAITSEQGIVQIQVQTLRTVRVVVPALRRVFTIEPEPGRSSTHAFDVLLPAANVPPIIP
jgi:hypothetical protein